jgi:hypothetical protein
MTELTDSIENALEIWNVFETAKSLRFICEKIPKGFGENKGIKDIDPNSNFRVRFSDIGKHSVIPSDGVPFIIVCTRVYNCQFGVEKHACDKKKRERHHGTPALNFWRRKT